MSQAKLNSRKISSDLHIWVGIIILLFGIVTLIDYSQHAWDWGALRLGVAASLALFLTSIGIVQQKRWAIYPWILVIITILYFTGESLYWLIKGGMTYPPDLPIRELLRSDVRNWFSIVMPIIVTLTIGKLILQQAPPEIPKQPK